MSEAAAGFALDAVEECYRRGWTDGLPTIPCDESALEAFLGQTALAPDHVLMEMTHLNRACTVRSAAINAVMAGCLPEYFPVVIAAWQAVAEEAWAASGMWQSTTGLAPALIVNGPVSSRLEINSGAGVLGPGFRANATIGRALRLAAINVFGLRPGQLDQSTHATPAKYYLCFGENESESPWVGYHETVGHRGADSTVTALSLRSVIHVEARQALTAEHLLWDIANTLSRTGSLLQRTVGAGLILSPEHAHLLAGEGHDRRSIRSFLIENATVNLDDLARAGKDGLSRVQGLRIPGSHPDAVRDVDHVGSGRVRVLDLDDPLPIVVAGAWNCGISTVIERFGTGAQGPATARIDLPGNGMEARVS